jgi:spore germination cell wall hydrolase CwlJ-like protein
MADIAAIIARRFPTTSPGAAGILARTLWGEARGEGRIGMAAVAACIVNRANHPRWWGDTIPAVCLMPWQFSCWNDGDPNLPQMLAVTPADAEYATALDLASQALHGGLADLTQGADSYYDIRMAAAPEWAARAVPTVVIGHHRFMRVELAAPSGEPEAVPVSVNSPAAIAARPPAPAELTADDLNAAELEQLQHQA